VGDGDFNLDGLSAATTGRETRSVYGQNVFGSFEPRISWGCAAK